MIYSRHDPNTGWHMPTGRFRDVKKLIWLLVALLAVGVSACAGGTSDSTSTTMLQAAGGDLAGLDVDVHQAPG